jgi:hypothetical protein
VNRDVIVVLGKTGYGKSWWAKLMAEGYTRKLVFDPMMSFRHVEWTDSADVVEKLGEDAWTDYRDKSKPFAYGTYDPEDIPSFGGTAFYCGNNLLILEECTMVFQKGERRMAPWAHRLCFLGRHRSCSVMLISQRGANMPIDFRSQANRIISFQQHEGDDLTWLKNFFPAADVKAMANLEKFSCIDYCNGEISRYSIKEQVEETFHVELSDLQTAVLV